jgi:TonB-linked SusC/RagA family outer membrane protein
MSEYFTIKTRLFKGFILLLFLISSSFSWAQTIRGVVSDSIGNPLPGANVVIKGTTNGTTTDEKGSYTLSSPATLSSSDVIVFTFIGFAPYEVPFNGNTTLNVQLKEDNNALATVVVTALGIKREEKGLGYATQTLKEDQINNARPNNWSSALSGKVAGLSLISSGSGPLNSTRIKLRGDNSLRSEGNNALVVLDGVPMNSGLTSSGVGSAYGAGSGNDVPVDFGNGISDINPDDIESITVLKGASATALYGSRAANGALIITTKSGARNKGIGVTINSNVSFNDVLKWPDYQYEYGQGTGRAFNADGELYYSYGQSEDGSATHGTSSAFGPRFNGQMYYQYDATLEGQSAERRLWKPYENNIKDFWRTGTTITNNISLEGGNDKSSARASITYSKNEWIMPNTGYERISAAVSVNHKISDKLKINSKVNYTNKNSDNLPATGYNNQSISYFMIFQNPNVDLKWYEPRWKKGQEQIDQIHPYSSFIDNPYLIAHEMTNSVNNNAVVGNISANYQFLPKFDLMVRTAVNMSQEEREMKRPYSTANFQKGYYKQQNISFYEMNTDALLSYTDQINSSIDIKASVGANTMNRRYNGIDGYVEGLATPGVYKLSNGISSPLMMTNISRKVVNSLYGLASLSYQNKVFLDLTGRNDWSSTLPTQNNSFFYPSASSSVILSEIFQLPAAISFTKIRLSAARVGNDTEPYKTRKYYGQSEFAGSGSVSTILHNDDFKPEITTSYEAGIETLFFGRRMGVDFTLYRNTTKNQILEVPLDPTTGYTWAVLNSGEVRNEGLELVFTTRPFQSNNFNWNATVTWAKNFNKVLSLAEGLDNQNIGYGGNATIIATVGGTTGDIYGFGFKRTPEGKVIYTKDGLPARPSEIQYIGNAYADWKGGFMNEFSYKSLKFSFLIDGQYGGIVYSQTHHKMSEQGKLTHTLKGREEGYIVGDGVVENEDGSFSPNTKQVSLPDFYADYYRRANVESNSFDASFIKLREARIEFNLPKSFLKRTFIQNASIALYGRDLAMITSFPMFDPETAALNGGTVMPGVEIGQMPTPRTYGINLNIKL